MYRFISVIPLLFIGLSCDDIRLTKPQAQALANAQAGARANAAAPLPELAAGTSAYLDGGLANVKDMPLAEYDPATLHEPAIAAKFSGNAKLVKDNPPPGSSIATILGLMAAGATALAPLAYVGVRLLKNVPGVGGVIGSVVETLWDSHAPDTLKAKDAMPRIAAQTAVRNGFLAVGLARQLAGGATPATEAITVELNDIAKSLEGAS